MIGLLSLALAQAAQPDCDRWGANDLQTCEIERSENDILDAASSVPAHQLGEGGLRFSSMPALGGDAYVIEFRPNRRGGARVRFTWFYGHQGWRWLREGRWRFDVTPTQFRELGASVDVAMARLRPNLRPMDPDGEEVFVLCTDGPGFLTELLRGGQVVSVTGSCAYSRDEQHPNRAVEDAVLDIVCPRFREEFDSRYGLGAKCILRDRRIRSARP